MVKNRIATLFEFVYQVNSEWAQVEVIELENDGSGLAFGIIGGRSTGVVVKTILPGGVADRVIKYNFIHTFVHSIILFVSYIIRIMIIVESLLRKNRN